MLALRNPDLWTSRKPACSKRCRVPSGSRNLRFLSRLLNIPTSMYVIHLKINHNWTWLLKFPNFVTSRQCVYEKVEKQPLQPFRDRPRRLLARTSFSNSETLNLLCHVIVVNVEHHMLPQFVAQQEFVKL